MTSHRSDQPVSSPQDPALERLGNNALNAIRRRFPELGGQIAALSEEIAALRRLTTRPPAGPVPPQIVAALRSAPGTQQLVEVLILGRVVRASLNPLGRPDPVREREVWDCLRDVVLRHAA